MVNFLLHDANYIGLDGNMKKARIVVCNMLIRNESWIIKASIPAALNFCDYLVIGNDASTDSTPSIIASLKDEYPDRISTINFKRDNTFNEMQKRESLLQFTYKLGADIVLLLDADEMITRNLQEILTNTFNTMGSNEAILLPMIPVWRSLSTWRNDNSVWSKVCVPIAFTTAAEYHYFVRPDGYEFHSRLPRDSAFTQIILNENQRQIYGGILHFQWVNWKRLVAKQLWYKSVERKRWGTPEDVLTRRYNPSMDETHIRLATMRTEWTKGYALNSINLKDNGDWYNQERRNNEQHV